MEKFVCVVVVSSLAMLQLCWFRFSAFYEFVLVFFSLDFCSIFFSFCLCVCVFLCAYVNSAEWNQVEREFVSNIFFCSLSLSLTFVALNLLFQWSIRTLALILFWFSVAAWNDIEKKVTTNWMCYLNNSRFRSKANFQLYTSMVATP